MDNSENRTLGINRMLKAPIDLVWEVWSKPEHIAQWWGPTGFTNTIKEMDFREGGEWKFTMHGPDGKNYPNRSVYKEITPKTRLVFEHFNPHFITTVIFEPKGEKTLMSWSALFDSKEILDIVVKQHNAKEGQKQNVDRLEKFLAQTIETRINQKPPTI